MNDRINIHFHKKEYFKASASIDAYGKDIFLGYELRIEGSVGLAAPLGSKGERLIGDGPQLSQNGNSGIWSRVFPRV